MMHKEENAELDFSDQKFGFAALTNSKATLFVSTKQLWVRVRDRPELESRTVILNVALHQDVHFKELNSIYSNTYFLLFKV